MRCLEHWGRSRRTRLSFQTESLTAFTMALRTRPDELRHLGLHIQRVMYYHLLCIGNATAETGVSTPEILTCTPSFARGRAASDLKGILSASFH
eukprot:1191502-Amphidinium_carterae.1